MVQNDVEAVAENEQIPPTNFAEGIPEGHYRLVGWGIDTTGRRLIDEIVQVAAYTTDSQFSQYIMPFADLKPNYRRRYNLRIINLGKYRMLRDLETNKVVKTKSEMSTLIDFLTWLEKIQGDATDGIILIYHEFRKTSPGMLLEAMQRYNLIERFTKVVKGFANGYNIGEVKCGKATKSTNLRTMARVLLNKDDYFGDAKDRAKACYDIAAHLAQGERPDLEGSGDSNGTEKQLTDFVRPFVNLVATEQKEIAHFKELLERQNTFRPVFGALLNATKTERVHASYLRKLLAENNIDYEKLKTAYDTSAKDGIEEILKKEISNAKENDITELLEILDCFFDPSKKAVQPKPRFFTNANRRFKTRRPSKKENKEKNSNANSNTSEGSSANASTDATPRSEPEPIEAK